MNNYIFIVGGGTILSWGGFYNRKLYYWYMVKIIFVYTVDVEYPFSDLCVYFFRF